jgi:hypothetical protein
VHPASAYAASGVVTGITGTALFVARTSTVYQGHSGLIRLVPLHGGPVQASSWMATIKTAGWGVTTEPSTWSATVKEDR